MPEVFFIINNQDLGKCFSHVTASFLVCTHLSGEAVTASNGSQIEKQVPTPGLLCTVILPPKPSMMRAEIARPRPVPLPGCLVVKKGSKIRVRFSSGMPLP